MEEPIEQESSPERAARAETLQSISLIVRVSSDESGRISGVVERVRTGEKRRFHGIDALASMIVQMVGEKAAPALSRTNRDDQDDPEATVGDLW